MGVAVGGVTLVALATTVVVLLCRNKPITQNTQEDEENTEVWGPPTTKRTEKQEFSTYDDMYADAQEAKPRAPATAEEEVKYEMGYEEGEYLEQ